MIKMSEKKKFAAKYIISTWQVQSIQMTQKRHHHMDIIIKQTVEYHTNNRFHLLSIHQISVNSQNLNE